jgi:hypothetical protein
MGDEFPQERRGLRGFYSCVLNPSLFPKIIILSEPSNFSLLSV